jgi:ribosomal 50S subunit-recycling heat shock protein
LKQLDVEKYLDEITVKVAGKEIKASANINKDDELVISFNNDAEIAAKENVEFTVEASFTEGFDAYDNSVIYAIVE